MKGNPILGTGSGSIGDVTVMRRNGSQVTRVRLRKIKNPMSQGQAEQRMYMAPITKFYSPLSKVLETSFEGLNKADSYAKFISVNANLARANGWAVKKGRGFVGLPYQISGGSLGTPVVDATGQLQISQGAAAAPTTLGELSTALLSFYPFLQNGDQVTFIYVDAPDESEKMMPAYGRFYIDSTSTAALPAHIFGVRNEEDFILAGKEAGADNFSCGWIFSRWDENAQRWARSTSFMVADPDKMDDYTGSENLAAAIASYMKSAGQTPVSDVYLNGSDD